MSRVKVVSTESMIETANLKLVPCELTHFEAILNDQNQLEQMLGVKATEGWLQFPKAMQFGYEYLRANPGAFGWWTYLFIHARENALIGNGGFVGPPDGSGMVEIGYPSLTLTRIEAWQRKQHRGLLTMPFLDHRSEWWMLIRSRKLTLQREFWRKLE